MRIEGESGTICFSDDESQKYHAAELGHEFEFHQCELVNATRAYYERNYPEEELNYLAGIARKQTDAQLYDSCFALHGNHKGAREQYEVAKLGRDARELPYTKPEPRRQIRKMDRLPILAAAAGMVPLWT